MPQHQHDCEQCRFLGSLATVDLYCCKSPNGASYIVRYSSEGSDFYSACDFHNELYNSIKRKWDLRNIDDEELFLCCLTLFQICGTAFFNLIKGV